MLGWMLKFFRKKDEKTLSKRKVVTPSPTNKLGYKEAVFSCDLNKMVPVMKVENVDLIDRHFLLQNICQIAYKKRNEQEFRELFYQAAQLHQSIFPAIVGAFKSSAGGVPPGLPIFRLHSTVLTEDRKFEEAIAVCNFALQYKVHDGTKSGFEGRIKRIEKKMHVA